MEEQYISVKEAAERLEVAPATIRNWCRDGLLKAVVLPSGRGYRVSELSVATAIRPVPLRSKGDGTCK